MNQEQSAGLVRRKTRGYTKGLDSSPAIEDDPDPVEDESDFSEYEALSNLVIPAKKKQKVNLKTQDIVKLL